MIDQENDSTKKAWSIPIGWISPTTLTDTKLHVSVYLSVWQRFNWL